MGTLGLAVVDTGNDGFEGLRVGSINVGALIGDRQGVDNDWIEHRISSHEILGRRVFSLVQGGLAFALDVSYW